MVPPSPCVIVSVEYSITVDKNNTLGVGGMCYLRVNCKIYQFQNCVILFEIIFEEFTKSSVKLGRASPSWNLFIFQEIIDKSCSRCQNTLAAAIPLVLSHFPLCWDVVDD